MRISDWSSDVCSSDLVERAADLADRPLLQVAWIGDLPVEPGALRLLLHEAASSVRAERAAVELIDRRQADRNGEDAPAVPGEDAVLVRLPRAEALHPGTDATVVRWEDVRAVAVQIGRTG